MAAGRGSQDASGVTVGGRSGGLGVGNFAEQAVAQAMLDLPGADARKVVRVTTEELAQRVAFGRGP